MVRLGLFRLAIVERPSRGLELCAGSSDPFTERRLDAAALKFSRVGPALYSRRAFHSRGSYYKKWKAVIRGRNERR